MEEVLIVGIIFFSLICMTAIKHGTKVAENFKKSSTNDAKNEENEEVINKLTTIIEKLEKRIEALETIIVNQHKTNVYHPKENKNEQQ